MAYNPKGLLRRYVKTYHSNEIKQIRSLHQQSKVSIDYDNLNQFLINETGKGFFDWQMYAFIDSIEETYNANTTPKEHISFKFINVP